MKNKFLDIIKVAEEFSGNISAPATQNSVNPSKPNATPLSPPGNETTFIRNIVPAPQPQVNQTSGSISAEVPSANVPLANVGVQPSAVPGGQLPSIPEAGEKVTQKVPGVSSDQAFPQEGTEVSQTPGESGKPEKQYLFRYVDEELDPDVELKGEYGDLYNRLINSEKHWNTFINNVQRVSDVQDIFNKIADPNASTEERNAAYNQLMAADPYLFRAVNWAARVKQDPNYALKDPETSRVHMHSLFEFGALRYASQGGALTKQLDELQKRLQSATDPNEKAQLTSQIKAIQQRIARRYASIYAKAMGDQNLTPEDLDLVYSNFASESGLGNLRSQKEVKKSLAEWFNDPNVQPIYKAGLLLGVPVAVLGLANMFMGNNSPAMMLLSLLGGLGIFMGGQKYLSESRRVEPGEPLISARAYSPYAPPAT